MFYKFYMIITTITWLRIRDPDLFLISGAAAELLNRTMKAKNEHMNM